MNPNNIILTSGQEKGKKLAIEWFKSNSSKQIFEIAGYAGTGKTTLVKYIIEELGLSENEVAYAAYTGKAALVMQLNGLKATTIHKLIYETIEEEVEILDDEGNPVLDNKGKPLTKIEVSFEKRESLSSFLKLIVLDECSMINQDMLNDLKSFNLPIIVLGDLCQLPPIDTEPVLLFNPDVRLTEIMRQKEGDPIIYLATLAREGKRIERGKYGKSYVIDRKDIDLDIEYNFGKYNQILSSVDIILCRKNNTRSMLNKHVRENIYNIHKQLPTFNDKLICRKNNFQLNLNEEISLSLVNGLIGYVNSPITKNDIDSKYNYFNMDFRPEICKEDFFDYIPVSSVNFLSGLTENEERMAISKQNSFFRKKDKICNKFEFGYAITVHLSQGSSWSKVFIYDEPFFDNEKALYTAITRARKNVIIAKKNRNYY